MQLSPLPKTWNVDQTVVNENKWNLSPIEFLKILKENSGFWCVDMEMKYLNIRLDTRDCAFILLDKDNNRIHPDRVLDAIRKWREVTGLSEAEQSPDIAIKNVKEAFSRICGKLPPDEYLERWDDISTVSNCLRRVPDLPESVDLDKALNDAKEKAGAQPKEYFKGMSDFRAYLKNENVFGR